MQTVKKASEGWHWTLDDHQAGSADHQEACDGWQTPFAGLNSADADRQKASDGLYWTLDGHQVGDADHQKAFDDLNMA